MDIHLSMNENHPNKPPEFIISRTFKTSRKNLWQAFSEVDQLTRWWGAKDFTWTTSTLDFRPGGIFHYCLRSYDGLELWGKFAYQKIATPKRILFINSFADSEGATVLNPWNPDWPLEILNTLKFLEENGKTTLTWRAIPLKATELQCETFKDAFASMHDGFKSAFNQLAECLEKG